MKCSSIKLLLEDYIKNKLTPEENKIVKDHISTCKECSKEISFIKNYFAQVKNIKKGKAPDNFLDRIHAKLDKENLFAKIKKILFYPYKYKIPFEIAGLAVTAVFIIVLLTPFNLSKSHKEPVFALADKTEEKDNFVKENPAEKKESLKNDEDIINKIDEKNRTNEKDNLIPANKDKSSKNGYLKSQTNNIIKKSIEKNKKTQDLDKHVKKSEVVKNKEILKFAEEKESSVETEIIKVSLLVLSNKTKLDDTSVLSADDKLSEKKSSGLRSRSIKPSNESKSTFSKKKVKIEESEKDMDRISTMKEETSDEDYKTISLNDDTNKKIEFIVKNLHGSIITDNLHSNISVQNTILIEIPKDKYKDLIKELETLGTIEENKRTEDLNNQYIKEMKLYIDE